eukprot:3964647-Prymnesium_polylepis.1
MEARQRSNPLAMYDMLEPPPSSEKSDLLLLFRSLQRLLPFRDSPRLRAITRLRERRPTVCRFVAFLDVISW